MTPAQRGAQTRRRNDAIRHALRTAERLSETRAKVAKAQRLVHRLAEIVASTPPQTLTTLGPEGEVVDELARAIGQLNQEVHWVKTDEELVNEMRAQFPDELAVGRANVIAFPQGRR